MCTLDVNIQYHISLFKIAEYIVELSECGLIPDSLDLLTFNNAPSGRYCVTTKDYYMDLKTSYVQPNIAFPG